MKDSKTSYWPLALIIIGLLLFFSKKCAGQTGTFDKLILKDRYGMVFLPAIQFVSCREFLPS